MPGLARIEPRTGPMAFDPFPDMFRRFLHANDWPMLRAPEEMRLDVTETDKHYQLKAELPGAKKEDIHVVVDGNYVSISAESKEEKKEVRRHDGERTLLHELHYGSRSRSLTLPHEVDDKSADARFENGVLSLTLPKRAPASGTTIAIK